MIFEAPETPLKTAWQCDLPSCAGLKFNVRSDVKPHQEKHLQDFSKTWTKGSGCPWPGCQAPGPIKTWKTRGDFRKHLKDHLKSLWCTSPGCSYDKPFARSFDLNRHSLGHREELEFPCPLDSCSASFRRKDKLYQHTRKEHENFLCPFAHCGKLVLDPEREDHVRASHGAEWKTWECALTGCEGTTSKFDDDSALNHLRTHHGIMRWRAYDIIGATQKAVLSTSSEAFVIKPVNDNPSGRGSPPKPCKSCSKKKLDTNAILQESTSMTD